MYLILSPDESPVGTLPVNIPALDDEYGYTDEILYPRGFGLKYVQLSDFSDIDSGAWYADSVLYALRKGVMSGYGNGTFGPNDTLTRAQLAVMLWRMAGQPEIDDTMPFADVSADAWYAEAVRWAASKGIVTGTSETKLSPLDTLTREQAAVMLCRYARAEVPKGVMGLALYLDSAEISDWARDAMLWATHENILRGSDGYLRPGDAMTRAEAAQLIWNMRSAASAGVADYADEANWAYYGIGEEKKADLFLICPTVDMNDEYNMLMGDEETKASFFGALNMERGIYEDSTRMFAPYYRQAAMKVYGLDRTEWEPYMGVAYSDVSAAFEYYLEHENDGRPIVLAGFSQGADMCYRLLEEYFGDEDLYDQLVAVYAIGWPLTEEMTEAYPQIVAAQSADDIGVVVSFDCEAPEVTETFINPADQRALSINPLSWTTEAAPADKSLNLGACFTDYNGEIYAETEALCGCYLDPERGVLKVTDIDSVDYPPIVPGLPEGAYHVYDYQFFFRNLQQNVEARIEKYYGNSFLSSLEEETAAK